jgi:predicted flap endonuclease-1-like 5' DNA nuclease
MESEILEMNISGGRRLVAFSVIIFVICVGLASRNEILIMLSVPGLIGVVCSKEEETQGAVASSAKAVAVSDQITETYVPEVREPRAELVELPVETIEGIGPKYGKKLHDAGVDTVADLLGSMADEIAGICNVDVDRAQRWIAMARFCWLESVSEEDAEAIVYGGGITDLDELAAVDPEALLGRIQDAVRLGHVKVPEGYTFELEMAREWIAEAKDLTTE